MGLKKSFNNFTDFIINNSAISAVVILFFSGALFLPNFLSEVNLASILNQFSIIGILALGQLLIVITGGFDLSVGGMVALFSIIAAASMHVMSPAASLLLATLALIVLGAVNGLLISRLKMPPFIVTFGVLQICRGVALMIADTKPVGIKVEAFTDLGFLTIAKIPFSTYIWMVVAVVLFVVLRYRKYGRYLFAVGSSEENARLSGIPTVWTKFSVYIVAALIYAVAAIIWTARVKSGQPIGANGYELQTIAAVVVGGGSLMGGRGTVIGTIFGSLLFGIIASILNLAGVPPLWQGIANGSILLLAISIGQIRKTESSLHHKRRG